MSACAPHRWCRMHRMARPFMYHRDWLYDSWNQFIWVWLRDCGSRYDRHPTWRRA